MGEVLLAGEEADEGAADAGGVVADGAFEHGVAGLEGVEDGALGYRAVESEGHVMAHACEDAEVGWEFDADGCAHERVWTSTERTAGRSWTMAFQLSPESAEA